eukprot:1711237-Ditylum_brightwellii.AAC.1
MCAFFTGEEGIEGLLFVEERFRKIARQFNYTDGKEFFDNFETVLADNAEMKWDNLVGGIDLADRDEV